MTKHIFVTGGVISSLGKGLTAASLALLLKRRGYRVRLQKLDPYLNVATVSAELDGPSWGAFARIEARYSLPVSDESWAGKWRTMQDGIPPVTIGLMRKFR